MFENEMSAEDWQTLRARYSELVSTLNGLAVEGNFASPEIVTSVRHEFGLAQIRIVRDTRRA